jgi:protease-4
VPEIMTLESDMLFDRRRLKRRLVAWRIAAIVAVVAVVVTAVARFDGILDHDHVARYTVDGLIVDDVDVFDALTKVAGDDNAKALIVYIDSPGGTFVGGEMLFEALRDVAEAKPVVAVMGTVAASAGFMVAVASDRIYARQGTITGSIGVIMQTTDITGLLEKIGVSAEAIKSAPLKAVPSPLEPLTAEARAATQAIIDDMQDLFTTMVAERRGFDKARVRTLADGRVYSGRQALANGLIDAIGGEAEARQWLSDEMGVAAGLPIEDVIIGDEADAWLPGLRSLSENMLLSERLTLDGLVAVWHPDVR